MNWSSWLAFAVIVVAVRGDPARFDDYKIFNVDVETEDQLEVFQLAESRDIFQFMYEPIRVGQQLKVTVSPDQLPYYEELVESFQMKSELLVIDVQRLINKEQIKSRAEGFPFDEFHRLDEINAWLDTLPATYPGLVTRVKGGDTFEKRSIEGVKISKNEDNPVIFIESNIHANEWITSSGALWMINEILTSADPEIRALLDNYTWYIFPIINPDGYEYSHTTYRMWRKNRSRNGLICWGTDLNRNWDIAWDSKVGNSSTDPCSTNYIGTGPFAEVEAKSFSQFLLGLGDKIKIYFSFHSAINMILTPYGYRQEPPADFDNHNLILQAAYDRLHATHGMVYKFGTAFDTICMDIS